MSERADLLARFSRNWSEALEGVVSSTGGRVMRQVAVVATDVGFPAGLMNSVILLSPLDVNEVLALTASLDAFFGREQRAQARTVFMFTAWPVPDLAPFGWEYVEQMPLMMRPPEEDATPAPPDVRVSGVRTVQDLRHFEQVMIQGFPVPDLEGLPAGSAFGPSVLEDSRHRYWLGWHEERPVSASASYVAHGLVHLTFLATLPQMRGRGFGTALARAATLTDRGLPAMLMASSEGQPLYVRLGYQQELTMPLWVRKWP